MSSLMASHLFSSTHMFELMDIQLNNFKARCNASKKSASKIGMEYFSECNIVARFSL
jgi:hypothetical protein